MASEKGIKTVIGGGFPALWKTTETSAQDVPAFFDLLGKHGITTIDAAVVYGDAEQNLGRFDAAKRGFIIDTKLPGGMQPETMHEEKLVETAHASLQRLNTDQVDILYLHTPCPEVPIASTLAGINTLYKEGAFRRFGLSNYKPEQVEEVYNVCKEKGYVLPSVYQGSYNAFGRHYESAGSVLPLLRKYNMSFYAYSPAAGGFLSKPADQLFQKGGRFDASSNLGLGEMYNALYADKPSLMKGHEKWITIAKEANINPASMALRWVKYNSFLKPEHGDAVIVGGRTTEQVEETLTLLEDGPLPESVAQQIDALWDIVKDEASTDNYHDYMKKS